MIGLRKWVKRGTLLVLDDTVTLDFDTDKFGTV